MENKTFHLRRKNNGQGNKETNERKKRNLDEKTKKERNEKDQNCKTKQRHLLNRNNNES